MRKSEKCDARTNAGPQDSNALIALLLQPSYGGARIKHGLSHRLNGATDVCAHQMIGALEFSGPALVMIRKRQTQGGHPDEIEYPASLDMTLGLRIPLWEHNNC